MIHDLRYDFNFQNDAYGYKYRFFKMHHVLLSMNRFFTQWNEQCM